MTENVVIIFGSTWCSDCIRVRRFFEKHNIAHKWVDVDLDESAREFVLTTNRGMRSVPTILFPDGSIFVEPSNSELLQLIGTIVTTR